MSESSDVPSTPPEAADTRRFGTFGGVFTPSILTILGVVMYLSLGKMVGNVGLGGALIIVVVAHLITLATGLSVSSIATNKTVGAGGAYYIISRSLGAPAGAAIGIPLFLGQALSVTFYIVGFCETVMWFYPDLPVRIVGTFVLLFLTGLTIKSADLAIKAQYFVMAAIFLSLISFFVGTGSKPPETLVWFNDDENAMSPAAVFAQFFPAVTGIMAGVGMSGDLKNPRKSLPRGTMMAIFVGFVVYMAFPVWLALNADTASLLANEKIVWTISKVPALIFLGVWGATLSSALGSILTAPRTMQALAADNLLPSIFARTSKKGEPIMGIIATFVLAEAGVLLGDLTAIAGILTMFFLSTYGFTNLACGLERWAASPNFRPDFRVPWWVSIGGALASFFVMSNINPVAMAIAFTGSGAIYFWIQRRSLGTTYGDARHGMWSALVRTALHRLSRAEFHPENWRPNLVVFGGDPDERPHLLELGSTIVQDRGIVTYFQLLQGKIRDLSSQRKRMNNLLEEKVQGRFPNVFARVDIVEDIYEGVLAASQSYGVGNLEANTVLIGWPRNDEHIDKYVRMLRDLLRIERSILVVRNNSERGFGKRDAVHLWWSGQPGTGSLMLLVAFLVTADNRWRKAKVDICRVVDNDDEAKAAEAEIRSIMATSRLAAEFRIISRKGREVREVIAETSKNASLCMLGLPPIEIKPEDSYGPMNTLLQELPTTILVRGAYGFVSDSILNDEQGVEVTGSTPTPTTSGESNEA
ncbi:MAG: amino acid permease [Deltaproteobacteria bacterium]|nr:amino acid permease [Deltaproteobacteria bacterium]